jgi:hypothetical protein
MRAKSSDNMFRPKIAIVGGDNDLKADPAVFKQLEELEFAMADRHPYKLLARYFQVIARKA